MSSNSPKDINWQELNFKEGEASTQSTQAIRYMVQRMQEAQHNPFLRPTLQGLMFAHEMVLTTKSPPREHRSPQGSEIGARRPIEREEEPQPGSPHHELRSHHSPSRHTKRRRSPTSDSSSSKSGRSKRGRFHSRRRRSPSPSPSPPSFSLNEESSHEVESSANTRPVRRRKRTHKAWKRARKLQKFKEGGKNVTFLSFDGTYGHTDKVLNFIQQFDAAFGGESFTEESKLRHVAMYLQKSGRQWWASLRTKGKEPKTWKECRVAIMREFLTDDAKDDVLTTWRGLKLKKGSPCKST